MILYYFYRGLETLLMLLPRRLRRAFFIGLANFAYTIDKKHRRVVRQNLAFTYGELPEADVLAITRYCYRNLMLAMLQVMENRVMTRERQAAMVRFENREIVDEARAAGRPIIFISAHYCNWELGATAIATQVIPTISIHQKLNNPHFDRYLLESRSRLGMTMVEKRGAVKHLARAMKEGNAISLMIDQNVNPKDGIIVNFFGRRATQTATPAFLARKYDAAVIPVFIRTEDEKEFTVTFKPPLPVDRTDDAEADILKATQAQADAVEAWVREAPKFWFWCHRRWKTEYPEIYQK